MAQAISAAARLGLADALASMRGSRSCGRGCVLRAGGGHDISHEVPRLLTTEAVQAFDIVIMKGSDDACTVFLGKRRASLGSPLTGLTLRRPPWR